MIALSPISVSLALILLPLTLLYKLWWVPLHLQHTIESQGIKGPSYKFIHGTTKELIRIKKQTRDGIVVAEGEKWLRLRKLANHAFHGDCLKDMVPEMIASVETMLENWRHYEGKEIDVCSDFRLLTSEDDIEADKIEKLLHSSIMEIVNKRRDEVKTGRAHDFGNDFLGSLLKAHHDKDPRNLISSDDIIDECKTLYFAGQETTYSLLSWSIFLLAIHADWQEKARKEVLELFGQEKPNSVGIARLKIVNMIIYETLRLYSPAINIVRRTNSKTKLGKYDLPANVTLFIPPLAVHRNPEIWGRDAHLFKPERFAEGLAKATNGNATAFLGFGFGARICVGMNFASNEAKITLSMVLQRYKFTLSPNYVHSPFIVLTTQPQHGVQCQLFVTEPEMIKEILMNKEGVFPKMDMDGYAKKLLGEALITNEGEKWAKIRKLANHTFHAESLKSMVPEMSSSVAMMLERWKDYEGKEIDVFKEFGMLTTEVISRTAFGSSYLEGKHVFEMVAKLTAITVKNIYNVKIPGISMLLKSDDEVEAEKLEQRIKSSILEITKKRENEDANKNFGSDYLGQLVKVSHESDVKKRITIDQMIDEIKTIYGAGHLTTTSLLGWCVLLLAINTEWQDKARKEVNKAFGKNSPHSRGIARLKIMNMIINECLRLYPPALTLTRKVAKEVKLGQLLLPARMNIFISILALHHSPQVWGKDVHLFKPDRFARGVAKATNNNGATFLPFGLGPRTCVGANFLNWYGTQAQLVVTEAELVKEILSDKYGNYPKIDLEGYAKKLLGDGLSSSKGEKWTNMRKLANNVFHAESLKNMIPSMISSVETMLEKWKDYESKEIEVFEEYRILTSDIISKTAFGSSYSEGKNIFDMLMKLTLIVSKNAHKIKFPGISRILPSNDDLEAERLEQGIRDCIVRIITKREMEESNKNHFLGKLLEANHEGKDGNKKMSVEDIVDECKTFYFAGHETTTSLLAWTTLLLTVHQEWQEKARKEVIELFGQTSPNADGIARLKIMNMVIDESLRLYPPVPAIKRKVDKQIKLGKITLPPQMELYISPLALHHDPNIWGQHVHLFRPERFAKGIVEATNNNPVAFLPFGDRGNGSTKGKMAAEEEEKVEIDLAAVAVAGVAMLAVWGLSKLFGGGERKMMKAPGQNYYMARDDFEDDPSAYFRSLRD
ncbi:cytochrome p450 cyp749a22 [Phtheirospermum japonicum]|uniref:Cytochrome p450 cyp749a22 n=1 Tax=Phtheirospermum japonicum TaxID=374723 RepID=A0A830BNR3_9LAMI|nr:cytochrome p450 cyp749a22 [Phtheirospermum japonicum]